MGAKDFSCAVSGLCAKMCQNTEDYRYTREKTSDTQGTPWANDCRPRRRNFLCVTDFPKVKIA